MPELLIFGFLGPILILFYDIMIPSLEGMKWNWIYKSIYIFVILTWAILWPIMSLYVDVYYNVFVLILAAYSVKEVWKLREIA